MSVESVKQARLLAKKKRRAARGLVRERYFQRKTRKLIGDFQFLVKHNAELETENKMLMDRLEKSRSAEQREESIDEEIHAPVQQDEAGEVGTEYNDA